MVSHWKAWLGMPEEVVRGQLLVSPFAKGLWPLCVPLSLYSRDTSLPGQVQVRSGG